MDVIRRLTESSDNFVMMGMANQNDAVILPGIPDHFQVNLGHKWARRVDNLQLSISSFFPNVGRDPVSAEYCHRAFGHFVQVVDEHSSSGGQFIDYKSIVYDLFSNEYRRAQLLQCDFDDVYRSNNAGAKASGFRK